MEVASYIFGSLAFIAAALAAYYSHHCKRRKIFTAVAIICAVIGSVCWLLDKASKRDVQKTPESFLTPTPTPTTAATATPTVVLSPSPTIPKTRGVPNLSESPSYRFTPKQIVEKIKREEFDREETAKAFVDLPVDWTLFFFQATRLNSSENMLVFFTYTEKSPLVEVLVYCEVPLKGNEHLRLTERTQRFRVRGKIEKADTFEISLKDSSFEPVAQ